MLSAELGTSTYSKLYDMCTVLRPKEMLTLFAACTGAGDEQYIFDLDVRLQYSDDTTILLQALEARILLVALNHATRSLKSHAKSNGCGQPTAKPTAHAMLMHSKALVTSHALLHMAYQ